MSLPARVTIPSTVERLRKGIVPQPHTQTFTTYSDVVKHIHPRATIRGEGMWGVYFDDASCPSYTLYESQEEAEIALVALNRTDPRGRRNRTVFRVDVALLR